MKSIRRKLYYFAALIFSKLVLLLPYRMAVRTGGALGYFAYHAVSKSRRLAEKNISAAFPEKSVNEVKAIALGAFINLGKNLFELFSFPKITKENINGIVEIVNREAMEKGFAKGKGVIVGSAHCGNWEMIGTSFALNGIPMNAIARRIYIEELNKMLVDFRENKGYKVILRSGREAAKQMLRTLRSNESLGILIDQDTVVPSVFVDFFGRKAWTPSGMAVLAMKTGAPVVFVVDQRLPDDRHKVICAGPVEMRDSGNTEDDIRHNTQLITSMTEEHIRKYPDQWVWIHDRWKTQPSEGKA